MCNSNYDLLRTWLDNRHLVLYELIDIQRHHHIYSIEVRVSYEDNTDSPHVECYSFDDRTLSSEQRDHITQLYEDFLHGTQHDDT